ncbi:BBT_HP_G0131650.mRNA.1.CDS.1 [Saccharomyces cerevisiae]|nr:BBT_HP_G0131650.mRNA.1.CDS.1 [Saccharomyces cerevisiae]CAI6975332.1 BBT_HP_G0131650.mRNA.1.CDS.1 [Saccharomyces cerevisiae]
MTRPKTERIARFAFDFAKKYNRKQFMRRSQKVSIPTRDIGGSSSTTDFTNEIINKLSTM